MLRLYADQSAINKLADGKRLTYDFNEEDIAGWILSEKGEIGCGS